MSTARAFVITDDDLANVGQGSYVNIEVPADYPATLTKVEDYDKTEKGGTTGWKLTLKVEGLPFDYYLSHSDASRWKLIEAVNAFEPEFFETRGADGTTKPINFDAYIGNEVGAHVILDESMNNPRKSIDYIFSLVSEDAEAGPEDVPSI